jgi:hypothetical protein
MTLKNNLLAIEKNDLKAFKTLVNLGSEFYIQAKVCVFSLFSLPLRR